MIEHWSGGPADANMAEEILVDLAPLVDRHPWWRARARLTLALLDRLGIHPPARVLDLGCGWGTTLEVLERKGYRATGADISRAALDRLDRPDRALIELDVTQPLPLPDDFEPFDAVLALDVIEHLDDDRAAVARLGRLVKAGGVVVVSVPALPDLFTEFDRVQGHRRRYLPETLTRAFADAPLELERVFWWGGWMVPLLRRQRSRPKAKGGDSPARAYRRYLELPRWPAPIFLDAAFALEQTRALAGRLKVGTSLFAIGRGREAGDSG